MLVKFKGYLLMGTSKWVVVHLRGVYDMVERKTSGIDYGIEV